MTLVSVPPPGRTTKPPIMTFVARVDESARADIRQFRGRGLIQIVDLRESNAGALVRPAHNCGISARGERRDDCRLEVIDRSDSGGFNCRLLVASDDATQLSDPPVVVRCDERAGRIVQFQGRIGQNTAQSSVGQRGTDRAHNNVPRLLPGDDESGDQNIVSGLHGKAGGNIQDLRFGSESQAGRITERAARNGQLESTAGPVESNHFPRSKARDIEITVGPKN